MAVNATRQIAIVMTGDLSYTQSFPLVPAENAASPAVLESLDLISGFNAITKKTGALGVTIIPPSPNTVTLTLKGITGDTGVGLHLTHPTSLGLASGVTTFGITASGSVTVRLVWT